MIKRVKYLLIVPPKYKRVLNFRIRLIVIVLFLIIFLGGVAGFLLPVNTLSLDVVEVNQKKNITAQNKTLLSKIRGLRERFLVFKNKVDIMTKMKSGISGLVDIDEPVNGFKSSSHKAFRMMSSRDLLGHVTATESFYTDFVAMVKDRPEYFESIPVMKPVSDECIITARFGKKKDPFTQDTKWHNGIDFSGERESPVFAAASGTVYMVQDHTYWGRRVGIRHRFGFSTVYAHLGTVNAYVGKTVKKGEVIATIGLSGMTVGPHLHYEIHHNDSAVDAESYFFPDTLSVAYNRVH
jgi:hypothetical protein